MQEYAYFYFFKNSRLSQRRVEDITLQDPLRYQEARALALRRGSKSDGEAFLPR